MRQPGLLAYRCSMLLCSPLAPHLVRVPLALTVILAPGGPTGTQLAARADEMPSYARRLSAVHRAGIPATPPRHRRQPPNRFDNAGNSTPDGLTAAAAFDIGSFAFRMDVWLRGQPARRNVSPPTRLPIDSTGRRRGTADQSRENQLKPMRGKSDWRKFSGLTREIFVPSMLIPAISPC